MNAAGLRRLVGRHLAGNATHFALASAGIVFGVSALTFFIGLGSSLWRATVAESGPSGTMEVARRASGLSILAFRVDVGSSVLTDDDLENLAAIRGVRSVSGRMILSAPAVASGGEGLLGASFTTELLVDGVAGELLAEEVDPELAGELQRAAAEGPGDSTQPCRSDRDCDDGMYCGRAPDFGARVCRHAIPALISPDLVELYNTSVRQAYGLPKVNPDAMIGLSCDLAVGASTLAPVSRSRVIRERLRLVGTSELAIGVGVTVPLEHVRRLNRALGETEAATHYASAILRLDTVDSVPGVVAAVDGLDLELADQAAGTTARLLTVLFGILGSAVLVILAVAGTHIMHVFLMHVAGRRRELGVMRALGARRRDIRSLILTEAAVVGAAAGGAGVILGIIVAEVAELAAKRWLPSFPGVPENLFVHEPRALVLALVLAITACVAGAFLPALKAARMDPAEAIRSSKF